MADKNLKIIISAIDEASKTLDSIAGKSQSLAKTMGKVGVVMTAAGAAITGVGIYAIKTAADFEKERIALNTIIGDVDTAAALFEQLKKEAKETPFSFEEVLSGTKQLLAMGASTQDVVTEMRMLGDVSAGLNVPMERLILNFGQVRTQGKLTGRELRDFSMAGVPLIETLATTLGKTKEEITDMVSAGEISFEMVKGAFAAMTDEGGRFQNLMGELSGTTAGQWERFKDQIQLTAAAIGEALLPTVNRLLDTIVPLIEKFTAFAAEHPKLMMAIFALGAALLVFGTILTGLSIVLGGLALASTALGIALLPLIGIVLLIMAVIAALIVIGYILITNWDDIKANLIAAWGSVVAFITSQLEYLKSFINTALVNIKNLFDTYFGDYKKTVTTILTAISTLFNLQFNLIKTIVLTILRALGVNFDSILSSIQNRVSSWANSIVGFFRKVSDAIGSVIGKLRELASAVSSLPSKAAGMLGFQHGGVVPGGAGTPVPAILHGGERVLPRTATDANPVSGSGSTVNIIIEGDVNSIDTLNTIVEAVKNSLGRDNELAQAGVGV